MLVYRIDLYFHDNKLAIKFDENGHSDLNIDDEIKRQKAITQKLGPKFIKIDPDEENFEAMNEVFTHIKQSSNKLTKKHW